MKKKTRNRIEIIILLLIALCGFVYVNKQERKYEEHIKESQAVKYIIIDGELTSIPLD